MLSNNGNYKYLIFDLDETLYPRDSGLLQEINRRISEFISKLLDIPFSDAIVMREDLNHKYGTTLRGLQADYQIDVDEYLRYVHEIPLEEYIDPAPWLRKILISIPLEKVIFTNSDIVHAISVLERLGVRDLFSLIFDVRAMDFQNKPSPQVYIALLKKLRAKGSQCIFVDDSIRNLQIAKREFDMFTILIDSQPGSIDGIDVILNNLNLLETIL
jgi:putative hydrolase of the HAD superfamily